MDKIPTMAKFQFNVHTSPVLIKLNIYIYIYRLSADFSSFGRQF